MGKSSGMISVYLHGFWGSAKETIHPSITSIEYTKEVAIGSEQFILNWAGAFAHWIKKNKGHDPLNLVGYSQGGRLLMGLLKVSPDLINHLVLISSHPGLKTFDERELRLKNDRAWAKKFRNQNWEELESEWNSQDVFKGGQSNKRNESEFDREVLAQCLENWSLAHQPDYRKLLEENSHKVTVIVGEKDDKYGEIYQSIQVPLIKAKGAAHRVPSDQPIHLAEILKSVLKI
jgi:2-succinyl-6-hydroxy-2,4-cyclohexadiene-1-carboxylate synthase